MALPSRRMRQLLAILISITFSEAYVVSITEFGAVGDGITLNTDAFHKAVASFAHSNGSAGSTLYIPPGKWLTGCFNLTSHMTLFLENGAEILASQDISQWPVIDPLPSYGRGREIPGRRYSSLIHAEGLTDVTITGNNGTINGQGAKWWQMFLKKQLDYSRGCLIELINTSNILLSNITLVNSPMWNVHPVYCSNVVVRGVTILAPHNSPNTDGINPDSSNDVCIHDCYISNGDDAIAIKSGWDEYGIAYGRPSTNIYIRNVTAVGSHGISLGSEMSGGISNVVIEDVVVLNSSKQAIHVKTGVGRGGYIEKISITNVVIDSVTTAFAYTGVYTGHPDNNFNQSAYPKVRNIVVSNVVGQGVSKAAKIVGIPAIPFEDMCFLNITLDHKARWSCQDATGFSSNVYPQPCIELQSIKTSEPCSFSRPKPSCMSKG